MSIINSQYAMPKNYCPCNTANYHNFPRTVYKTRVIMDGCQSLFILALPLFGVNN